MEEKFIEISPMLNSNSTLCKISERLRKYLGLSKQLKSLKINCGMHTVSCPIVIINEDRLKMVLSHQTFHDLHIPLQSFKLKGKVIGSDHLKLGPFIGVLTETKETEEGLNLGSIHEFCEELAITCQEKGMFLYIFSLRSYNEKNLTGYYFYQNKWVKAVVPYPDVVHNRIHNRKSEYSNEFLRITNDLMERKIPYFNNRFLNKWEVHQILFANEHLLPFIPKSTLLDTKSCFEDMLKENKDLFIKPINGSQGRRIFRVKEMEDGRYHLDFTTFSGDIKNEYPTFKSLYSALHPRLKREAFLLQETIQLMKYQNRTLDFRYLCHKKDIHQWKVTSAVARVSGDNQFVANLARGGDLLSIKDVLTEIFGKSHGLHLRKLLAELALEAVNIICLHAGGDYGEFGVDLAIDKNGHPWIIEVNTKPSKTKDGLLTAKTRPSTRAIINYCSFLSKFD